MKTPMLTVLKTIGLIVAVIGLLLAAGWFWFFRKARGTLLAAACGLDQGREDFDEDDLYAAIDELSGRRLVPKDLNATRNKLGLLPLFAGPPVWAPEGL